jgi:hypothetical protein
MSNRRLFVVVLAAFSLGGCVVAPYPRSGGYYPAEGAPPVVVDTPPPAPYVEVVPVVPFPGAVWIGGYWGWSGHRHQWVPGRWERGRTGYGWAPHRWQQRNGRWHLEGGGWARR